MANYKSKNQNSTKTSGKRTKATGPRKGNGTNNNSNSATNRNNDNEDFNAAKFPADNDPSWYARSEQLLRDAASVSFGNALGTQVSTGYNGPFYDEWKGTSIPGVVTLKVAPLPGAASSGSDPVNAAARAIYSFVRHANSGSSRYDATNLMMYIMAMDSLYSLYAFLCRAYGVISSYSFRNKYMPRVLIRAMGLDFDDLIENIADFRMLINTLSYKISSMVIPMGMPFFQRHMWMFEHIYLDAPDEKAQMYMYVPAYFYKYIEGHENTSLVGTLVPAFRYRNDSIRNIDSIRTEAEEMISAVYESEDLQIMSGDILKAFGANGIWKLNTIGEDYTVRPQYSPEVLTQIHNAGSILHGVEALPETFGTISEYIDENRAAGYLQVDLSYTSTIPHSANLRKMLDLPIVSPSPADVMVATRLMPAIVPDGDLGTNKFRINSCGSEVVVCFETWWFEFDEYGRSTLKSNEFGSTLTSTLDTTIPRLLRASKFNMHPILWLTTAPTGSSISRSIVGIHCGLDNYTFVDDYFLHKCNEVALLSMFDVPRMGLWTNGN